MSACDLVVVILAAGESARLGTAKQMVQIGGEPLLQRTCRRALAAGIGPVAVVLGCDAALHQQSIRGLPVEIQINAGWREGIAASLRVAVDLAAARHSASLILLGDQYRVTPHDLRRLHAAWRRGPTRPCVSTSADYAGPPTILPTETFDAIRSLRGDAGARGVLYGTAQAPVEIVNPRAAYDIDTVEDLRHAVRLSRRCPDSVKDRRRRPVTAPGA